MTDEPETGEVWTREGESWIPNAEALCAEFGIVALSKHEGELYAVVRGKGEVVFASLFAAPDRSATVRNIKPA